MPTKSPTTRLGAIRGHIFNHKVRSLIVLIIAFGIGYFAYGKMFATAQVTKYVLTTATTQTVVASVSGSGQVSPSSEVDLTPKVSGEIVDVPVTVGEYVQAGQPIAYIDSTTAQQDLRNAEADLKSAQLALAKLQEPADQLSVTQAQDTITKSQESQTTAQSNLAKAYTDSYNDVVATYLDLPALMASFKDIVIGTEASRGSQWNIDYYQSSVINWDEQAMTHRNDAYNDYVDALNTYNTALADYKALPANPSNDQIEAITKETHDLSEKIDNALGSSNTFIQYYEDTVKNHNQNPSSVADTALTNLTTYIGTMDNHSSTLLTDSNNITSDQQTLSDAGLTITESQQSLTKLQQGADPLDIQTDQLNIEQKQNAVLQAQQTLDDYTVTAPFAGYVAKLTAVKGAQTSGAVASLITKDQIAQLTLNEVDAAKVQVGQKVTLTFDAVTDLTLAGTVVSIDPLGTVTQGVVSYTVNIDFASDDPRVKPGMTVNAAIITGTAPDAITVPASAIKTQGTTSYVLVVKNPPTGAADSGTAVDLSQTPTRVTVTTGLTDDTNTQITSGLSEGDVIVSRTVTTSTQTTSTSSSAPSLFGSSATRGGGAGGFGGAGGGGAARTTTTTGR